MIVRVISLGILLFSMAELQAAYATESQEASASKPLPEMVLQKLQLLKTLLTKSPTFESAVQSEDASVKQQTERVLSLYTKAKEALDAGNTVQADELSDEALQMIEIVTRQSPSVKRNEKEQIQYSEILADIHNLQATYHDLHIRLKSKAADKTANESEQVRKLIDQAQRFARDHHYSEASKLLKRAHALIITSLNQLLKSTALMYDLKFKSPSEEFDYELARYHSYEELIPIAYAELKPSEENKKLSERFVQESREIRDAAKQQAKNGDIQSGILSLLEAVKRLQAALRIIGLVLTD